MADVPKDLLAQMKKLEEIFTIPQDKLKQISDHFVSELTKGLTKEGGSIVSTTSIDRFLHCIDMNSAHEPHLVYELSHR